ncbi:hypothetical protein ES703_25311 [subsurface metagenome]
MTDGLAAIEQPFLFQFLYHYRVGIFHKLTGKRVIAGDITLQIHLLHEVKALLFSRLKVNLTKGRCHMHDAGAVFHGDKIGSDYPVGQLFIQFLWQKFGTALKTPPLNPKFVGIK